MLTVWWTLWLYPVLAMAPDLSTCSRKWVRMTDRNYQRAIKHYSDCVALGQALDPPARGIFQSNIVINLQKTCDYFFQRTALPTSGLIGIVREVAKILEGFDEIITMSPVSANNSSSWSTIKGKFLTTSKKIYICTEATKKICTSKEFKAPKEVNTPNEVCDSNGNSGCSLSALYFMLAIFLILLIIQVAFIVWLCCCNNCICLEFCCADGCGCESEDDYSEDDLQGQDVYRLTEIQHDLASLSSENIGSDSEFEALLKMSKIPASKRQWHSKEAD